MSVGAIHADALLAATSDPGGLRTNRASPRAADFATLLGGLQAWAPTGSDSAVKTEASRIVSMVGGARETIIAYTDGTSDTQLASANDVPTQLISPGFDSIIRPPSAAISPNSDLEPEAGLDVRLQMQTDADRRIKASIMSRAKAATGKNRVLISRVEAPRHIDWQDIRAGKLIDVMV